MPPLNEALDDDYVIGLLKKDVAANQKRYLTNGLGSLLSRQPRGNAPKPNTRFLKNIIRETDSHNAALKAKEEEESRARLRELRGEKRRRDERVEADEGSSKRRRGEEKQGRWANALGGLGHDSAVRKAKLRDEEGRRHRDREIHRGRSGRDRDNGKNDDRRRRHRRERESRSMRSRSRSPSRREERSRRSRSRSSIQPRSQDARTEKSRDSDSDPLEDLIGPNPAPTSLPRGRGALKSSEMDSRFDPSYNPKEDVDLESDDRDDWDMALEALRDRAKWRAQGADRLRAAGFTDEEVSKWEKGGEKDIEDVRWRKRGEGREWDRGKVMASDGHIDVKAEWGRLKDT